MIYGSNLITNPSAETGDTTGWDVSNVTVESGGYDGSYYFNLDSIASMQQVVFASDMFASDPVEDFQVEIVFKLGETQDDDDANVYAYAKAIFNYDDGSIDSFVIPCVTGLLFSPKELTDGWLTVSSNCSVREHRTLNSITIKVVTTSLTGGLYLDSIELKKSTGMADGTDEDWYANSLQDIVLKAGVVGANELADNSITTEKLVNLIITSVKLASSAVETEKLADNAVIGDKIAADAIIANHISAAAIEAAAIKAGAIGTTALAALAVTADKIAANTITADKYNQLRNVLPYNFDDSLDGSYPLECEFYMPPNVDAINSANVHIVGRNFRAYAKGAASGGGATSSSGGGQTSSGGGSHDHTVSGQTATSSGGHTHTAYVTNYTNGSETTGAEDVYGADVYGNSGTTDSHVHSSGSYSVGTGTSHNHSLSDKYVADGTAISTYSSGTHTHDVSGVTSSAVGTHTHTVSNHTHTVPNHTHSLTFGIYESTDPTGVNIYVDNGSGYGSSLDNDDSPVAIDYNIASELTTDEGWKKLRITSSRLGRVVVAIILDLTISSL